MRGHLIEQEKECIDDCIILAGVANELGNTQKTRQMLEDALKSVKEIERLKKDTTVVLIGSVGVEHD